MYSLAEECLEERRTEGKSWEEKLREDLTCNYNNYKSPVKNETEVLEIKVRMMLKYFNFDYKEELLTVHSWFMMLWYDEFLTWNSSDYGGIKELVLENYNIWTPNLSLLNNEDYIYNDEGFYTQCSVDNTGLVMCVPQLTHTASCLTKLTNWPYDSQTCTFIFGNKYEVDKVKFVFLTTGITTMGAEEGPGWNLRNVTRLKISFRHKNWTGSFLMYSFELDRQSEGPVALVIFPLITAASLTLSSLLLDTKDFRRLTMSCFSLFIHFFLTSVELYIPSHGSDIPKVLLFLRNSFVATFVVVAFTLLLQSFRTRVIAPPGWIIIVTGVIDKSPLKYLIFTKWESDGKLSDDAVRNAMKSWTDFANILNNFSVIIFYLTYLIMIYACLPF